MTPNIALEKKLNRWAYVVSAAVLLLVGLMRQVKVDVGVDFSFLPPFHASLNALAAIILLVAFWHIKNGRVEQHRKAIYAAMVCSALFLVPMCCIILPHLKPNLVEKEPCARFIFSS
jgi:putative membrane protein